MTVESVTAAAASAAAAEPLTIALIGTCDTKLQELLRLRQLILQAGAERVLLIDGGRWPASHDAIDVGRDKTPGYADHRRDEIEGADRSRSLQIMAECATAYVRKLVSATGAAAGAEEEEGKRGFGDGQRTTRTEKIHGIISAGGSGGTSLAAPVMREGLPIGFPKLIVSTIASGDVGPLVGESDVTMMYSVVDIAGSNALLERIFGNAAGAIVGMGTAWRDSSLSRQQAHDTKTTMTEKKTKKRIGITMFGVTTPCVNAAREYLESTYDGEVECFVFHATGHGGRAMERLVGEGTLDAVLDLTTTEVCDELMGGSMSAGPRRLEAAASKGIPCVVSVGATDMVNFGPRATVPAEYQSAEAGRKLHEHNSVVTLMRTTPQECERVGAFIADKLTRFAVDKGKVAVILPRGGVSVIATPGQPFADAEADAALFEAVRKGLDGSGIRVVESEEAINDEGFATQAAEMLAGMLFGVS